MKTHFAVSALVFGLAVLSGCSSSSAGSSSSDGTDGTPLACNDPEDSLCQEYGAVTDDDRQNEVYCKTENIVPSCSKDNLRATCADSNYTGNNMTYWYADSHGTDDQLKTACDDLSGQFTLN